MKKYLIKVYNESDEIATNDADGQDIRGLIQKGKDFLIIDGGTYTKYEIIEQEVQNE